MTILPITSKRLRKAYPFEVSLPKGAGNLPKESKVKADQIRTLDKARIVTFIGRLEEDKMAEVKTAIKIHLALD